MMDLLKRATAASSFIGVVFGGLCASIAVIFGLLYAWFVGVSPIHVLVASAGLPIGIFAGAFTGWMIVSALSLAFEGAGSQTWHWRGALIGGLVGGFSGGWFLATLV